MSAAAAAAYVLAVEERRKDREALKDAIKRGPGFPMVYFGDVVINRCDPPWAGPWNGGPATSPWPRTGRWRV